MRFWNFGTDYADGESFGQAAEMAEEILSLLRSVDGGPMLVRIGHGTEHPVPCRYLIDIKIAPGLILPTEFGSLEGLEEELEYEDEDVAGALESVREALHVTLPIVLRLSEVVHVARLQARRIVAGWNAEGVPTRLIDVQLAPHSHWRGNDQPALQIIVEKLRDNLQPGARTIQLEDPADLTTEMSNCRDEIALAYAARTRFASLGASGTVSRLALNAMGHFGDASEMLRRFASERCFWLPDDTAIMISNGLVSAGSGDPHAKVDWWSEHVNVDSLFAPLAEILKFVGQPVSMLIEHEFLSDDLIITGASTSFHQGRPTVTIEFSNPELLFCSTTGRVWEDAETAMVAPPVERSGDNIVQFPRQRARAR